MSPDVKTRSVTMSRDLYVTLSVSNELSDDLLKNARTFLIRNVGPSLMRNVKRFTQILATTPRKFSAKTCLTSTVKK